MVAIIPPPVRRRPFRTAIIAIAILTGGFFFSWSKPHEVNSSLFQHPVPPKLTPKEASAICRKHGYSPYPQPRKVYDLFPFNVELDWLHIRMNTLAPYVDYFVIVEGKNTFTNIPKPATLEIHWDNYTAFHPQMVHYVVDDPVDSTRAWDHEDFFRNALLYQTFPHFRGSPKQADEGDVIIVSDIDEIIKPEAMVLLRYCDFPERLTIRSHFYYYSYQWAHRGHQWEHPQATTYHGLKNTIGPVNLRNGDGGPALPFLYLIQPLRRWWQKGNLWSAAWHCSSCLSTIKDVRGKIEAYSHTSLNTEENKDPKTIVHRFRNGIDLFGRWGQNYDKVENNPDVPPYVREHSEEYMYMLNRDGEDGAFKDYSSWF